MLCIKCRVRSTEDNEVLCPECWEANFLRGLEPEHKRRRGKRKLSEQELFQLARYSRRGD